MAFSILNNHSFMSLKTFRKSGVEIATPVWFVQDDDSLFVVTNVNSGKVKRIRNNSNIEIASCDVRGGLLGEDYVPATAQIVAQAEREHHGYRVLRKKYGLQFRLFMAVARLRRHAYIILEITPRDDARSIG